MTEARGQCYLCPLCGSPYLISHKCPVSTAHDVALDEIQSRLVTLEAQCQVLLLNARELLAKFKARS